MRQSWYYFCIAWKCECSRVNCTIYSYVQFSRTANTFSVKLVFGHFTLHNAVLTQTAGEMNPIFS